MSGATATAALPPLAGEAHHAAPAPPHSSNPYVGIVAVLLGALISTLFTRVTNFGLADLRGAVHAGFDEGAWLTTAETAGQMCIGPLGACLGLVFGARRVLVVSSAIFAVVSLLAPFAPDLWSLLAAEFLLGISSGTFIPLTIGFVLQNLPRRLWPYGLAAYGLSLELSLNIPASLEGYYLDHLSWHWIYWQGSILAVPMLVCIHFGMPRPPVNWPSLRGSDFAGMLYLSAGASMLYAAIDQGNRLDWLSSGTINGLLAGGLLLIAAFVIRELTARRPWINLGFLLHRNIAILITFLVMYRFIILATSYVIPQYLAVVQNFRALQTGDVLLWIALPQFVVTPLIAWALGYLDPRYMMAAGVFAIGVACVLAGNLTPEWQTVDFLPSQVLQAFGQSGALVGMLLFLVRHLKPADALTFGVVLQTARLFGGEVGSGFMQTFVRVREQASSFLLGLHVQSGELGVTTRLDQFMHVVQPRAAGTNIAQGQAMAMLSNAVEQQANVLSFIDGFLIVSATAVVMLVLVALLRPAPPSPA